MNMFLYDLQATSWSRNWDDEAYETEAPINFQPQIEWKSGSQKTLPIEVPILFVGFRGCGAAFLHAFFSEKKAVAKFSLSESSQKCSWDQKITDRSCLIYENGTNMMMVICQYDVPADKAYEWTKVLFQQLRPQRVIVLDRLVDVEYKILEQTISMNPPLLKKVETNLHKQASRKETPIASSLEAGNIVDKGPAAIITFCELNQIPGVLYFSLEPSQMMIVESLMAFEPIVKSLGIAPIPIN
jgi:hypothetical protein